MTSSAWPPLLDLLEVELGYEERLDALLGHVTERTKLPAAYLYAGDRPAHLRLERALSAVVAPGDAVEGGAETIEATPPLELPDGAHGYDGRLVTTPVGLLWSVELADAGALLVGPLERGRLPGPARRALDQLRDPLAFVVRRLREERRLSSELATATARLEAGQKLAASALDLRRYVNLLLELALRSTRTEAGFVAIVNDRGTPAIEAALGLPDGFAAEIDLDPEHGLLDWSAAAEGGALFVRDVDAAARLGIRSLLAVPLLEAEQPLGIFALVNFGEAGTFDEGSLDLLATFADQIRQMLHNDRLFRDFAARFVETLKGLAASLDARRPHTHGHHERVSRLAGAIARELGHAPEEADALEAAGLIHDAGMAGVGTAGYHADTEHPAVGAALVDQLPLHPWVAAAVAAHHEWWDGWGFPRGASGEEIGRAGAVLAAAEFVDEMASGDPVREPYGADRLVAELEMRSGSQFAPDVAEAASRVVRQDLG